MIRLIPALLVALALLPAEIRTQQLPNFSGVWELDAARSGGVPGAIGVTCAATSCNVIDVVAGRRAHSRARANGREAIVSLRANTLITTARD